MIKQIIENILIDIDNISNKDIMKESVEDRLNKSLKLYYDLLNKSYDKLVDNNISYRRIIKLMNKKGD